MLSKEAQFESVTKKQDRLGQPRSSGTISFLSRWTETLNSYSLGQLNEEMAQTVTGFFPPGFKHKGRVPAFPFVEKVNAVSR